MRKFFLYKQKIPTMAALDIQHNANGLIASRAVVNHIHPIFRLKLDQEDETVIVEAELTKERFLELNLKAGEHVYVKPRNLQVFLQH